MRLQMRTGSTPGWMIGGQPCRGETLGGPVERKMLPLKGGHECVSRKLHLIQRSSRLSSLERVDRQGMRERSEAAYTDSDA